MPTLLVVDDSVTVQRVIALTLAEYDVRVVAVSDPQEAMERMTAQAPDIVLVASVLTQISGYDLARWMHNTPALQGVPVLLLVGAFEAVDEAKLAGSGASGIIEKPIEPTIVINRVKELLGLKAETKPAPTGRLFTSVQGPKDTRPFPASPDRKPAASVPDQRATPAEAENTLPVARPPRAVTSTIGTPSKWEQLRDQTGLDSTTPSVEGSSTRADGYLGTLDAAFADLDQQLSGRAPASPGPRNPEGPLGREPDAIDPFSPGHRPAGDASPGNPVFEVDDEWFGGEESQARAAARAGRREIAEDLQAPELLGPQATGAPHPIFEVDDEWFAEGDTAPATRALEQQQLAAEMGIHDVDLPEPASGPASDSPANAQDVAFGIEGGPAEEPPPMADTMPAAPATTTFEAEQPASAMAPSDFNALDALLAPATAPYTPPGPIAPAPEAPEAPDARDAPEAPDAPSSFAELLAYEQGDRSGPPVSQPAPVVAPPVVATITDDMLDQIAARVAERLSAGVFGDQLRDAMTTAVRETVRSVVADTSERIVRDEIDRIRSNRQQD